MKNDIKITITGSSNTDLDSLERNLKEASRHAALSVAEVAENLKRAINATPADIAKVFEAHDKAVVDRRWEKDPLELMWIFDSPQNIARGVAERTALLLHNIAYWIEDRLY